MKNYIRFFLEFSSATMLRIQSPGVGFVDEKKENAVFLICFL